MAAWTPSEKKRRKQVEAGQTVLANRNADTRLIEWAQENKLYVYIGRPGEWGNPYEIGEDGERETVIESFRVYFARKFGLHKKLPQLRGKVLGCFCYPSECHGNHLIDQLETLGDEHDARG